MRRLHRPPNLFLACALVATLALPAREARGDLRELLRACVDALLNLLPAEKGFVVDANGGLTFGGQPIASPTTLASWRAALAHPELGDIESIHNRDPDLFVYRLSRLPEDLRELLLTHPSLSQGGRGTISLGAALQLRSTNFFSDLARKRGDLRENWPDWVRQGVRRMREATPPARLAEIRAQIGAQVLIRAAVRQWRESDRYVIPFATTGSGREIEVQIGNARYRGVRKGDTVELIVPDQLVRPHAGNPLNPETLARLSATGGGGADYYPAIAGWDGKFYLTDRNHRFARRPKSADGTVVVQLSSPPSTASLSIFAMLGLGLPPPKSEKLVEIYQGKRSPLDAYDDVSPVLNLRNVVLPEFQALLEALPNPTPSPTMD